jgi:hypothetical protein
MVKTLNIGKLHLSFVLRHRWEKELLFRVMEDGYYKLGIWLKKSKIVGRNDFKTPTKWKNNLVRSWMLGFDLLLFTFWVEADCNGMHF